MGSLLFPVLADMFTEVFKSTALDTVDRRPSIWLRCVDDTFLIWPHGPQHLQGFLDHLNNLHPNIKFTMDQEERNLIPFLDVKVSRQPTHTDWYLHSACFHHSRIKSSVNRARVHPRTLKIGSLIPMI